MLFHKYQRALLETLYAFPFDDMSINEIARRANVDPGNTKRYVQRFSQVGFVTLTRKGKTVLVRADLSHPETRKIFELFEIARVRVFLEENKPYGPVFKDLADALYKKLPQVRMIAVFGPCAKALATTHPVDLAIVVGAEDDIPGLERLAAEVAKRFALPFEFKLHIMSASQLVSLWQKGDDFCAEMWLSRAVLLGENFFWHTAEVNGMPARLERLDAKKVEMVKNA